MWTKDKGGSKWPETWVDCIHLNAHGQSICEHTVRDLDTELLLILSCLLSASLNECFSIWGQTIDNLKR
jgi:hypothetical protein